MEVYILGSNYHDINYGFETKVMRILLAEFHMHQCIGQTRRHFHGCFWSSCQGCLTRRTWRFGCRFRTRTDGQTCPSVFFRQKSACKNFFTIFFFTVGNFSEADVSNQNPRWRRARTDGRGAHRQVRVGADG